MRVIAFADYHQLHIRDSRSSLDFSARWDADALRRRFVCGTDAVAIVTARDTEVPVEVTVHPEPPMSLWSGYDQVIECDLVAASGRLVLSGPTDYITGAAEITVPPGLLRVRVSFSGLGTVSEDGVDGFDVYEFAVWPAAEQSAPLVLRQWEGTSV